MNWEEIRALCGKIPPKPDENPYQQPITPVGIFLHADDVNFYDTEIFPFPKYDIVVFAGEPNPPCCYVYCDNTAIAVSMETGEDRRCEERRPRSRDYQIRGQKYV